jgi:ABC-type antimicrobial peptide transport system permease subunit
LVVSLGGAVIGIALGWATINVLQHLGQLRGIFVPTYDSAVFLRALLFGMLVAFLGALYPALRAAFLAPLKAVRHE